MYFDRNVTWAVVLDGGGARGSYQIGAWRAMNELGIKYNAVAGTSVGALNGSLMTMRDLDLALDVWSNITFSQVMRASDEVMGEFFRRNFKFKYLGQYMEYVKGAIKSRGISVEPLREFVNTIVDYEKIKNSDVDFFFPAYCLTDRKGYEFRAKELDSGRLHRMLLASACFPLFQKEYIDGKYYVDGGVFNAAPFDSLINRGYKNILSFRIRGAGIVQRVKIPSDTNVFTVQPSKKLGSVMNFDTENSRRNMQLGYEDAMRFFTSDDIKPLKKIK